MHVNKSFRLFFRGRPITTEDWCFAIEACRELIMPHLGTFGLPELRTLHCLADGTSTHDLGKDAVVVSGDNRFSLITPGIFCKQNFSAVERITGSGFTTSTRCNYSNGTLRIWGLTESGLWVLVTVGFIGESGYKDRGYEKAKTVNIIEASLPDIIAATKEHPQKVWKGLYTAINNWTAHRKELYEQALYIQRMVEVADIAAAVNSEI